MENLPFHLLKCPLPRGWITLESLRTLVSRAAAGEEEFDEEFATRTLREVLKIEQIVVAKRNLVGWLSQPIGLVPWVGSFLQKAVEVGSGRMVEVKLKKQMDWFFLVSEVDIKHHNRGTYTEV